MKNLLLALALSMLPVIGYAASGSVDLGPSFISGSSGSGAATDLSNLTSPTAINQTLLFGTDATFNIGAVSGASRPNNIYAATVIAAGYYPVSSGHTFAAMLNGAFPQTEYYAGGSDAFSVITDGNGLSFASVGLATNLLRVTYTTGVFQDTSGHVYLSSSAAGVSTPYGFVLATAGAQPTCAVGIRGMQWIIQGGAGVADIYQVCQKDAANAYGWVTH